MAIEGQVLVDGRLVRASLPSQDCPSCRASLLLLVEDATATADVATPPSQLRLMSVGLSASEPGCLLVDLCDGSHVRLRPASEDGAVLCRTLMQQAFTLLVEEPAGQQQQGGAKRMAECEEVRPLFGERELMALQYAAALMGVCPTTTTATPSSVSTPPSWRSSPAIATPTPPPALAPGESRVFFSSAAPSPPPRLPMDASISSIGGTGSPHWRALFQPKSVRIALRVPLFSFGDFVTHELLRPLSPLTQLLTETAMIYLYSDEGTGPRGTSGGEVKSPELRKKMQELWCAIQQARFHRKVWTHGEPRSATAARLTNSPDWPQRSLKVKKEGCNGSALDDSTKSRSLRLSRREAELLLSPTNSQTSSSADDSKAAPAQPNQSRRIKYLSLFASTINVGSIGKRPHTAVTAPLQSARELPTSPPSIITANEASQDHHSSSSHRRHCNHSFDTTSSDSVPCAALSSAACKAGYHRAHSSIDNSGTASLCPDCPTFHHASLGIPPGGGGSGSVGGLLLDDEARLSFHADLLVALQHLLVFYFSHQWHDTDALIRANEIAVSQLRNVNSGLQVRMSKGRQLWRRLKMLYFKKRAMELLHAQRQFKALGELLKIAQQGNLQPCGLPRSPTRGPSDPGGKHGGRPRILFLGGGMGAGKSSLLQEVLGRDDLWSRGKEQVVVIEADRIKLSDPIFLALTKIAGGSSDQAGVSAEEVHDFSTSVANSQLLAALLHGRDVVMDGTLTWEPYVVQTIDMVRSIHRRSYRMGPGYRVEKDGTVVERYWDVGEPRPDTVRLLPYYIEIVGCFCSPHVAVARGLRRSLLIGRGVPVRPQLKSHKMFAQNFMRYAELVDEIRLFETGATGGRPVLVTHKPYRQPLLVEPERFQLFQRLQLINEGARDVREVFPCTATTPRYEGWSSRLLAHVHGPAQPPPSPATIVDELDDDDDEDGRRGLPSSLAEGCCADGDVGLSLLHEREASEVRACLKAVIHTLNM